MSESGGHVIALCGGIGGAKLALGLYTLLGEKLTVIVNTGDDFEHLGLAISPDVDTVLYTLADVSDKERGWGRADESWNFMAALAEIGGETWFQLGDRDLALHVERTRRRRAGEPLSGIVRDIARRIGITATILPMSDDPLRTIVVTADGRLPFQRYFVESRCEPIVREIAFEGADAAKPAAAMSGAFAAADLDCVVICPSNPYLSVDPMLAIAGVRQLLRACRAPVIAVSPIIGGRAVKGPTVKIMAELGIEATNASIERHYAGLIDGLVVDEADAEAAAELGVPTHAAPSLMNDLADRVALARHVLAFARELAKAPRRRNGKT
jgi:LPPG:FO 2-phospho-L-lactate transferase